MYRTNRKTFTLIEMLIVVVIIGILAAALIPRLQNAQGRARDVRRKADLHQINNAILMYYNDNNIYPQAINSGGSVMYNDGGSVFSVAIGLSTTYYGFNQPTRISSISGYITSIPIDPLNVIADVNRGGGARGPRYDGDYMYAYGNVTAPQMPPGHSWASKKPEYSLFGQFESTNDPDRNELRVYTIWGVYPMYPGNAKSMYSPNKQRSANPN